MQDKTEEFEKLKEYANIMVEFYNQANFSIDECEKCLNTLNKIDNLCASLKQRDDLTSQDKKIINVAEHSTKITKEDIETRVRLGMN